MPLRYANHGPQLKKKKPQIDWKTILQLMMQGHTCQTFAQTSPFIYSSSLRLFTSRPLYVTICFPMTTLKKSNQILCNIYKFIKKRVKTKQKSTITFWGIKIKKLMKGVKDWRPDNILPKRA